MASEEHYLEFCQPYDEIITKELGNVCIHYCGRVQPFHGKAIKIPGLKGMNMGDPQMHDVDTVVADWTKNRIAVLGWGHRQKPEFLAASLGGRDVTGFSLVCSIDDRDRAKEIVRKYRDVGLKALAP
jgi:hypothetical protein